MKVIDLVKSPIFFLLLMLSGGFALYYSSLSFDFLYNFDDDFLILNSSKLKDFSWEGIKRLFTEDYEGLYHPMVSLSWMADIYFFGYDSKLMHLVNLIFHLSNTVLVYILATKFLKNSYWSLLAAALFLVHPMHVENVVWLSSRKDLVVVFFSLLALIFYLNYLRKLSNSSLILVYLFSILALLSKPSSVVLPFVLILFDFFFDRGNVNKRISMKLPLIFLAALITYINYTSQANYGYISSEQWDFSIVDRFFMLCFSFSYYLVQFFIPFHLSPKNVYPEKLDAVLPMIYYASALVILALGFIIWKYKNKSILWFGLLFLALGVGPILKIIPTGNDLVSNRYAYLPYIGLYLTVTYWALNSSRKWLKFIPLFAIVIFSFQTYAYQFSFENGYELWSRIIEEHEDNKWAKAMALNERGQILLKSGQQQKALKDINAALAIEPQLARGLMNRATINQQLNNNKLALADLNQLLLLDSTNIDGYRLRAVLLGKNDLPEAALADLTKAINLDSTRAELYNNRGIVHAILDDTLGATQDFKKVIQLNPNFIDAYINLGNLYLKGGLLNKAQIEFEKARKLNSNHLGNNYLVAKTQLLQGDTTAFVKTLRPFEKNQQLASQLAQRLIADGYPAISLNYFTIAMGDPAIRDKSLYQRSQAYSQIGEYQNAIDDLMAILENRPNPQFFYQIAELYKRLENKEKSCKFYREAANRDHEKAKVQLNEYCGITS